MQNKVLIGKKEIWFTSAKDVETTKKYGWCFEGGKNVCVYCEKVAEDLEFQRPCSCIHT